VIRSPGEPSQPAGRLSGVLERNHQGLFEPGTAGPGSPDVGLFEIAYGPPSQWPDSNLPDYAETGQWFADQLFPTQEFTNVRDQYDNAAINFGNYVSEVQGLRYPGSTKCNCTKSTFSALQDDYANEFKWVAQVASTLTQTFKEPVNDTELANYVSLQQISSDIEKAVAPPPQAVSFDFWDLIAEVLNIASFAPEVGPAFGVWGAFMDMAGDISLDPDGGSADLVQTTTDQLAADIPAHATQMLKAFDVLASIALHDHDKLSAMNDLLTKLDWTTGQTSDAVGQLVQTGARRTFYSVLMRAGWNYTQPPTWGYPTWTYFTNPSPTLTDLRGYTCSQLVDRIHLYPGLPASAQYAFQVGWQDAKTPLYSVWWWVKADRPGDVFTDSVRNCGHHPTPPASLTDPIFAPAGTTVSGGATVGAGAYAPWFWKRNFDSRCWYTGTTSPCHPIVPHVQTRAPAWGGPVTPPG
jgi:hypothetical protein